MALAVIIDIMKPTALAFVMPGMTLEYGLKSPLNPGGSLPVAYVALSGIVGTEQQTLRVEAPTGAAPPRFG